MRYPASARCPAAARMALLCLALVCAAFGCQERAQAPRSTRAAARSTGTYAESGSAETLSAAPVAQSGVSEWADAEVSEGRATPEPAALKPPESVRAGGGLGGRADTPLFDTWRMEFPWKASTEAMDVYLAPDPRLFWVFGRQDADARRNVNWICYLDTDGRAHADHTTAFGLLEAALAYGTTVAVLERGDEMLAIQQEHGDSHDWLRAAHARDDVLLDVVAHMGFPSYDRPNLEPRWPGDYVAENALQPSAVLVGSEVWLASSHGGCSVKVSHTSWGHWRSHDWARTKELGPGIRAGLTWSESEGFFATATGSYTGAATDVEVFRGPVYLYRSPDGEEWTSLGEILNEPHARYAVPAVDPKAGLVVVYAADRDSSCPLFAARSPDFGQTWGKPQLLTDAGARCAQPRAVMYDARLYLGYLAIPPGLSVLECYSHYEYTPDPPVELYTMAFDPMDLPGP